MFTSEKKDLNGITLLDSRSRIRNDFLKLWFRNAIDGIRFYAMMGRLTQAPIIGSSIKKSLYLYYRYIHTNSIILPLEDIEEILQNANDIYVEPCPCRLAEGEELCEAPLFTCMRINHSATIRKEQKQDRGITPQEAIEIARNANRHGLVMSLESCIQPYQNNICMCCTDCCVAMKMRYKYQVPIYHFGPYIPESKIEGCKECGSCTKKCPVGAIKRVNNQLHINLEDCLGCGLCAQACPENCIVMVKKSERLRIDKEPGPIQMFLSFLYIYLVMVPAVSIYKLFAGSQADKVNAKPRPSDYIRQI